MSRKTKSANGRDESSEFKVDDRRHWAHGEDEDGPPQEAGPVEESSAPARPTIVDEYRERAEEAERKLHEYIDAFKQFRGEQDAVRERLRRDVDRRVRLQFGELVGELLTSVDDLDLALAHAADDEASQTLARGVAMVRDKFLDTLERRGVERIVCDGEPFDPNVAEALQVDPVDDPKRNGTVTRTLRPGYRIDDHVIRAAQVAVGRHDGKR